MMKKAVYMAVFAAISLSAQAASVEVFNWDFTQWVDNWTGVQTNVAAAAGADGTVNYIAPPDWLPAHACVAQQPVGSLWNLESVWGLSVGQTNASKGAAWQSPFPAVDSSGWALRVCAAWPSGGGILINTGLPLDPSINYVIKFKATIHNGSKVPLGTELGGVRCEARFAYTEVGVVTNIYTAGSALDAVSNLVPGVWSDMELTVNGGGIATNYHGAPLTLFFNQGTWPLQNDGDLFTWVDDIVIEAYNPWADYVALHSLSSDDRHADEDGDGVDNFTEMATGSDPNVYDTDGGIVGAIDVTGSNVKYVLARHESAENQGLTHTFYESSDLINDPMTASWPWDWSPTGEDAFGPGIDGQTNTFDTVIASNAVNFIEVKIGHPLYEPLP